MKDQELIAAMRYNIEEKDKILYKLIPENDALKQRVKDLEENIKVWLDLTAHTREVKQ